MVHFKSSTGLDFFLNKCTEWCRELATFEYDLDRITRLLDARDLAGSARLSTSGRALNISISPYYYTVPLRSVLAVLDGRNRKGAVFVGK